jgi:serine/threonine protein kinase
MRVVPEVEAMRRLREQPDIVTLYDFGEHEGQPYVVLRVLPGDVEELIKKAAERRPTLEHTINTPKAVCRGLEFARSKGIVHRDVKPGSVCLQNQ